MTGVRCTCPAATLGRFWQLVYVDRPGVYHVACGRLRDLGRQTRPLVRR